MISNVLTCLCRIKKRGEIYLMKHPDEFRRKIKISDEEIGELEEIQESSIIESQRENIRIRNNTVSYSILENATLPDVSESGQVIWQ